MVKKFKDKGIDGLRDPGQGGAKPKLPYDTHQAFKDAVLELQANRVEGRIKGRVMMILLKAAAVHGIASQINQVLYKSYVHALGLIYAVRF